jgi:hypothetical protein
MQESHVINGHVTTRGSFNKKSITRIHPSLLEMEKDIRKRFTNDHVRESRSHYDYSRRDHLIYLDVLKRLAKEKGLTQTNIYRGIKINQAYLSRVWLGQREVKKSLITKLADFLEVPFSELGEKIEGM